MTTDQLDQLAVLRLYDHLPDAIVWYRPVFNENNQLSDFEVHYCNDAVEKNLGISAKNVIGTRLSTTPDVDKEKRPLIFEQCVQVYKTGKKVEVSYYSSLYDKFFHVLRIKVLDGILNIIHDQSNEIRAGLEQKEQERKYQHILDTSEDGVLLLQCVRNKDGYIADFRIEYCNKKGFEIGRLPAHAVGKTLFEVLPHLTASDLRLHRQVVETGVPASYETTFITPDGQPYGWFMISLTKFGDGVVSRFIDISKRKQDEKKIEEQKNMLQSSFDTALNMVVICEAVRDSEDAIVDLKYVRVNRRYLELRGMTEEQVVGKTMLQLFPLTKKNGIYHNLCQVIKTGTPSKFEVYYQGDGLDAWYYASAVKIGDNSVFLSFEDITDKKKSQQLLEESEQMFRKILEMQLSIVILLSPVYNANGEIENFKYKMLNRSARHHLIRNVVPVEGKLVTDIFPDYKESERFQYHLKAYVTGEPQHYEFHYKYYGKDAWLEALATRIGDDLLVAQHDLTESKLLQLKLERSVKEMKQTNESLEEFTRAASHDLKEPIRKVQYFAEWLKSRLDARLNEEERKMFERMDNANNRMRTLVDDLLQYSYVSRRPVEMEQVDLSDTLRLVLTDLELLIKEKNATICLGELPSVHGHRRQLQQLFQNLIDNALKYHRPDVAPRISISSTQLMGAEAEFNLLPEHANKVFHLIEVKDNGIGFDEQYAERIFNVFTRLHGNSEYAGSGVGLSIVKKVVDNHSGYIRAYSKPGEGATFKVLLPAT